MPPMGMQTLEFIPNTIQEEWSYAWNVTHEIRWSAKTEIDKERALKRILWMPHGLLHAPTRGEKIGTRQFKEIARKFLLWRQRDIDGVIKL
jgi:hypothetical protein